jgi:hypothetical protein
VPVECRDIAELTRVGTAARELDVGDEVLADPNQLVGRLREVAEVESARGFEPQLLARALVVLVEILDEAVGGVPQLADVEDVRVGLVLGAP